MLVYMYKLVSEFSSETKSIGIFEVRR